MSLLQSTIQQIKKLLKIDNQSNINTEFDDISSDSLKDARDKLLEAVLIATEDGTITPAELRAIRQLQKRLKIDTKEMNRIKLLVIQGMVEQILEDDIVTTQEFTMLRNIVNSLYPDHKKAKSHQRFTGVKSKSHGYFEVFEEDYDEDYNEEFEENDFGLEEGIAVATGAFAVSEIVEEIIEESEETLTDES